MLLPEQARARHALPRAPGASKLHWERGEGCGVCGLSHRGRLQAPLADMLRVHSAVMQVCQVSVGR